MLGRPTIVVGESLPMSAAGKIERAYSVREEILHAATHGIGAGLAAVAAVFLFVKVNGQGGMALVAISIYAASMILMFLSSTLYHAAYNSRHQSFLKMLDHSAIYFKIAGSYTPFALISLPASTGLWVAGSAWAAALAGTVFKVVGYLRKSSGRYKAVSLVLYLTMGWAGLLMISPLAAVLDVAGIYWVIAGGVFYTVGAIFYAVKSVAYFHAIWHLFVMAGSACHFVAIYFFVL